MAGDRLLLPGLALQRALWPEVVAPWLPLVTLALLWAFGLTHAVLLAETVSGSRGAGLVAGAAVAFSAPVFLSGYHFYPEAAALALVPWLVRVAIEPPAGRTRGTLRMMAVGVAIGALPWLHVKFCPLALVLLALIATRAGDARRVAAVAAPVVALSALLALYDHRITGLWTPDALYRRYGEIYAGPGDFLSVRTVRGAIVALFGAVDGLFVMAPVTLAGALAGVWLFRRDRRTALSLAAVVASVVVAAAVHGGGAPGPPARLMAPVACVFAVALAVGLVSVPSPTSFRATALVLALAGLAITTTMHEDWRRAVSPYRRMFTVPETDFAHLLPGMSGPGREARLGTDIARGLALITLLAFWAWRFGRPGTPPDTAARAEATRWTAVRNTHLGFWATIAAGTILLSALGP